MPSPRLVIFDCDGTLVDSQHMIVEAMGRAFDVHDLPRLPRETVLSIVGLSLPIAVHRLLPDAPRDRVTGVSEAYKQAFGELRRDPAHHEPLYPGALEAIAALVDRPDVLLGIATGKSRRGVDGIFERFGLAPHFVTVQTADDNPSKPHPEMIAAPWPRPAPPGRAPSWSATPPSTWKWPGRPASAPSAYPGATIHGPTSTTAAPTPSSTATRP